MSTHRIGARTWRVSQDGAVTCRAGTRGPWQAVTQAELRSLGAESPEWEWLRSCGVRRGGGPTSPEAGRVAKQVLLRLRPATVVRLDAIAAGRGLTRSETVAALVDETNLDLVCRDTRQRVARTVESDR